LLALIVDPTHGAQLRRLAAGVLERRARVGVDELAVCDTALAVAPLDPPKTQVVGVARRVRPPDARTVSQLRERRPQ